MPRRLILDTLLTLLSLTLVWWLLRDGEWLTDERLADIKTGMTLEQVMERLGKPHQDTASPESYRKVMWTWINQRGPDPTIHSYCSQFYFIPPDDWTPKYVIYPGPNLVRMCNEVMSKGTRSYFWFGRRRALWILTNSRQGQVTHAVTTSLAREGGGLRGWLMARYDNWRRPQATVPYTVSPLPTMPAGK